MQYRKKPVTIDALRYTGDNLPALSEFLGNCPWVGMPDGNVAITTLEGNMAARPGDWVIRGVAGEYYPCKPHVFEQTYEEVK